MEDDSGCYSDSGKILQIRVEKGFTSSLCSGGFILMRQEMMANFMSLVPNLKC